MSIDRIRVVAVGILIGASAGCRGQVGPPTEMEVQQMNAWAEVVTPKDRAEVTRQANQHTDWLERRKVQWITGEYKRRYTHLHKEAATTQSATQPAAHPASQPAFGAF